MVICSNQDEEKSHIISKLHLYRRPYTVPSEITKYQQYLQQHFVSEGDHDHQTRADSHSMVASGVDRERCVHGLFMYCICQVTVCLFFIRSCVRVVSSTRARMGKSLFITRMAEQLWKQEQGTVIITIPIHGPDVTNDTVMECLESHQDNSYCAILHFDIAPSVCTYGIIVC